MPTIVKKTTTVTRVVRNGDETVTTTTTSTSDGDEKDVQQVERNAEEFRKAADESSTEMNKVFDETSKFFEGFSARMDAVFKPFRRLRKQ